MTNQARMRAIAVALLTIVVGAGCLISGTEVLSFFIGDLTATGDTFDSATIDLNEEDLYEDHKDDIRLIDRFGWTCTVQNPGGQDATVSVFASSDPNLTGANVASQAIPVFVNFAVPANSSRPITYDESIELLPQSSFEAIQGLVEGGIMTFYSTANAPFTLNIQSLELIITFTVGL